MKNKLLEQKRMSILFKIFGVILIFTISVIFVVLAFWGLVEGQPNPVYAHLHLLITVIILIIAGSIVASFIIRKILKPLYLLYKAVEEVGKGNLDQTIQINSNDELGKLAIAFNQMTFDLKKMMLARDQLLLDVSHELRTPITRAKLALEMMPESKEKESLAGDLKEMEIMITEMLESERLKNGAITPNLAPIKVADLLQKLMDNFYRERNRIVLFPVVTDLTINIDESLIITVLRNLIDNSLKYSSNTTKLVEISVIRHNQDITIQIEDFGQGIPDDKLPYVFEPFYRVDQSRSRNTGGYGLGLHLCKRIMDLHGTEIKLQNKTDSIGLIVSLTFQYNN
ncbi:MAG: HAMP domain-containing protein [Bacteroidales bacterium]|nr:HAMP domain-containing protein [Bacteroidales bacterium]